MRAIGLLALSLLLALGHAAPCWADRDPATAGPTASAPLSSEGGAPELKPPTDAAGPAVLPAVGPTGALGLGQAGARALGASVVVGLLLALTLQALRWMFRRADRSADASRVRRVLGGRMSWFSRWVPASSSLEIVDRSYVGAKESVCVVRVGSERFLIGVTPTRICLLGRLDGTREVEPDIDEPAAADFAHALSGAAVERRPSPAPAEASVRTVLTRSRERLARLGVNSVHAGGRRV